MFRKSRLRSGKDKVDKIRGEDENGFPGVDAWPEKGPGEIPGLVFALRDNVLGRESINLRYGHSAKPAEGRRRVPADQSNTSPCQIIDRLKTTDDQVERVPASGR